MKTEHMLTAGEAAQILGMTPGGAYHFLGEEHGIIRIPNGHKCRAWRESYVREKRAERDAKGIKPREISKAPVTKEYKPGKSLDFEVDRDGRVIEQKKTFRGRTCRYQGCTVPVPTGKIYCDDHSEIFKAMQKNVATHGGRYC